MRAPLLLVGLFSCTSAFRFSAPRMMAGSNVMQMAKTMKSAAAAHTPFSDEELDAAVLSLQCLIPDEQADIDWAALRDLYATRAHLSHKDWAETQKSARQMEEIIGTPDSAAFRKMFERVLVRGHPPLPASVKISYAQLSCMPV